jgi:hypothetical protein
MSWLSTKTVGHVDLTFLECGDSSPLSLFPSGMMTPRDTRNKGRAVKNYRTPKKSKVAFIPYALMIVEPPAREIVGEELARGW